MLTDVYKDDDSAEEEMWIPHGIIFAPGKQYPPTRAHSTSCFIKMCELSVIFNQILINIYDPLHQLSQSVIEGCVRTEGAALQSWWDALPHFLRIDTDNIPAYAPPSHIVTLKSVLLLVLDGLPRANPPPQFTLPYVQNLAVPTDPGQEKPPDFWGTDAEPGSPAHLRCVGRIHRGHL